MATELNSDGLVVAFGRDRGVRGSRAGVTRTAGKRGELVLLVDLEGAARTIFTMDRDNDGTLDGFSGLDAYLPSGAKILDVDVLTVEAIAGTTPAHTIGTFQIDGTAIDADGIRDAALADGAQVGTALTQDAYVSVVTTGTHTAGQLKIVVHFLTA